MDVITAVRKDLPLGFHLGQIVGFLARAVLFSPAGTGTSVIFVSPRTNSAEDLPRRREECKGKREKEEVKK